MGVSASTYSTFYDALRENDWPPASLESLAVGEDAELLVRIINLLSGPQAARLMCVSRLLKRAVMACKWPPWSPEPHILADGTVCAPLSGRYSVYVRPVDGWARVCQVITDAPEGATVLMKEGVYEVPKTINMNWLIYIFGNGATIQGGEAMGRFAPVINCCSARGALVGLSVQAHQRSTNNVIHVDYGAFRLQGCTFTVAENGGGVYVQNYGGRDHANCPTIVDCKIRGRGWGFGFINGACGTLRQCDVRDCRTGVFVHGGGDRSTLRIEDNVVNCKGVGVRFLRHVDPAFTLGPGNMIHGDEGDIDDQRNHDGGNAELEGDDDDGDDV